VVSRTRTPSNTIRGVVINSGNANACTGTRGRQDAVEMTKHAAAAIDPSGKLTAEQFVVMSTGIIGRFLPMEKIKAGITAAAMELDSTEQAFLNACDGILTTDIARKTSERRFRLEGRETHIVGMCKGAGMIGPKMATMLAILITDAPLEPTQAQRLLQSAANKSFNCISVEGHMSTNDTLVMLASQPTSSMPALTGTNELEFARQLNEMATELAKKIPDDGEGATHLIEIRIQGANTDADADAVARSVALSNLVKTAITGGDPNWGRIVSAAGYTGVPIRPDHTALKINGIPLFERGEPIAFDAPRVSQSIKARKLTEIDLQVGLGPGSAIHWTTDLNTEYVRFNSEYTT
ncbi:MAG TPA: bifunctional glutamate N-acetyltransferase/amino-acid acetyltransferase ArgJ, partial [Pirellula sp.]|nr:bifunctional glutamate N-acetyltransferase/amino-acid acetyltransferase ArgJ [Pirellula sp.]